MQSYLNKIEDWKGILKDKNLLFDSDAIVSILAFGALKFLDELEEQDTSKCYISPVFIELLNTNNLSERTRRQAVLSNFRELPLRPFEKKSLDIQIRLHENDCYPSPTDIFLGSALAFHKSNLFLITGNIKDFPSTVFERMSSVILQNDKNIKVLSIIRYLDKTKDQSEPPEQDIPF